MRLAVGSSRRRLVAMWVATLSVVSLLLCSSAVPRTGHAADGVWTQVPPPDFRLGHSAVYDRTRHRMIVFGGMNGLTERNDVWVLELSYPNRWRRLLPTGTPPSPRRLHTAVYDIENERMLVFGGGRFDGVWHLDNQVWALELAGEAHWTQITPAGTPPVERFAAVAVFDALRNRMVVHGGSIANGGAIGDVCVLDFNGTPTWTQLAMNTTMGPRFQATAILDSLRDRMVVMGGFSGTFSLGDTWTTPLGNPTVWNELATAGTAPFTFGHCADYDPLHDQMIVFGGFDAAASQYLQGAWRLRFGTATPTWSRGPLSGPIPPPIFATAGIYDPVADAFRTFGGWGGHPSSVNQDVWTLWLHPSPNWGAPYSIPTPPSTGRWGAAVAYDAVHRRMILFGGLTQWHPVGAQYLNDVWLLDLLSPNPAWTQLAPVGSPPDGRQFASLVYDPSGDRVILYGGEADGSRYPDVWSLSLTGTPAWTALTPSGTPPFGRSRHGAVYDPLRDRMVIFGGASLIAPYYQADAWTLSLSGAPAWSQLSPTGTPPIRRQGLSAVLDAARDRMLVFGGQSDLMPILTSDVWALNLAGATAWDSIEVAPGPSGRRHQVGVHDPVRDRLLVFGGYADQGGGPVASDELWALSLAGSPAWTELHPAGMPDADAEASAVYDPAGDRMIKYGGFGSLNGVWIYQPGAVLDAPSPVAELGPEMPFRATPNPARGPVELSFVLPVGGRAQLRVYDISGREVAQVIDATLPAGTHAAHWNGQIAGRTAPAGLYFGRLDHPRGVWTTRLTLIR